MTPGYILLYPYPYPRTPYPLRLRVRCYHGFRGLPVKSRVYSKPTVIPWVSSCFGLNISYYNLYTYNTYLLISEQGGSVASWRQK